MFYKVIKENTIVDAMESVSYVRQNLINKVIISSTAEICNGILSSDGTTIWHLEGQPEFTQGEFETVKLVEIEESEYTQIKEVLTDSTSVDVDDERIRQPMTTTEMLEKFDAMQERLIALEASNNELQAQIALLKGNYENN